VRQVELALGSHDHDQHVLVQLREVDDPLAGGPVGPLTGRPVPDQPAHLRQHPDGLVEHELDLAPEVPEQRALSHSRACGDVGGARGAETALGEQLARRGEQVLPRLVPVFRPPPRSA
jgi:hypothetical protein